MSSSGGWPEGIPNLLNRGTVLILHVLTAFYTAHLAMVVGLYVDLPERVGPSIMFTAKAGRSGVSYMVTSWAMC